MLALGGLLTAGCAGSDTVKPPANKLVYEADWAAPIIGQEQVEKNRTRRYFSASEQTEVERILSSIAAEWDITERPTTSPRQVRWVDMDDAVRLACNDSDVATTSKTSTVTGMEYRLLNIVGLPGILVVTKTDDERIYEAQCQIGLFPGLPSNQANAQVLIEQLRKNMETLASQRRRFVNHEHEQAEAFEQRQNRQP